MAQTYLTKTFGSSGNLDVWTVSFWVKKSLIETGNDQYVMHAQTNGDNQTGIVLRGSGDGYHLQCFNAASASANNGFNVYTSMYFRDPSAWYHIVVACDTTEASGSNGLKMYVNGAQVTTTVGAWNQNVDTQFSKDQQHVVGAKTGAAQGFGGYLSQFIFANGTQYAASTFGSTNANGIWVPNTSPTVTYGSNGFKLDFAGTGASANASGFGADSSGNNNHFTSTNLGTNPSTTDTCQNNFCTFNPLIERPGDGFATFAKGNCQASGTSKMAFSSIALPSSGKWYAEFKVTAGSSTASVGLRDIDDYTADGNSNRLFYRNDGQKDTGSGAASYGNSWTTGDIISIACNIDNSEVTFYKNGTAQDSGTAISQNCANQYLMVATAGGWTFQANFGNPTFAIASSNADANGEGSFEYAVPSTYYALCTNNLALYGG